MCSSAATDHVSIWVVVPAAGIGSRMQTKVAKQYLLLKNKTILEHTLERLLQLPQLTAMVVAHNIEDDKIASLNVVKNSKIELVIGGAERSDSVLNGLNYIADKARDDDWVLVHDAARPCIDLVDIENLMQQLKGDLVGGILGVPVSDTVKRVATQSSPSVITETLDRSVLWQAQTPQMFRFSILRDALQQAVSNQQDITDEASAVEQAGLQVKIIEGSRNNIKITRPEDLVIAELILSQQALAAGELSQ